MDFGNLQQGFKNAFLIVVAIFTSTFQNPSASNIISPLQSTDQQQPVHIIANPRDSSESASYKETESTAVTNINLNEVAKQQTKEVAGYNSVLSQPTVLGDEIVSTSAPVRTENIIIPTLSPTPTLTSTPTITPIPTVTKTREIELQIPSPSPIISQDSLNSDTIFQLINDHRKQLGYTPFEKDEKLCELAKYRAPQLEEEIYTTGAIHKGLYDLNLPYVIIENMASYPSEQQIFNFWMNSTVHRMAIEGNFKYSCGVCNGNSCAQLFTNYSRRYN